MANVYFKILNKNIGDKYVEDLLASVQHELHTATSNVIEDLYEATKNVTIPNITSSNKSILEFYVAQQILKNSEKPEEEKSNYIETANKKYWKNSADNKYYKQIGNEWVIARNVCQVNDDGSYVVEEKKTGTTYSCKKLYDIDNVLISVQVVNFEGKPVCNMMHAAEIIGMKCEYVKKFKYSGISGNSNDIIAAVLNQFSSAKKTGYYMDNNYNLFKWNTASRSFVRNRDEYFNSPLLVDYEFDNTNKVIRKEYTGV